MLYIAVQVVPVPCRSALFSGRYCELSFFALEISEKLGLSYTFLPRQPR